MIGEWDPVLGRVVAAAAGGHAVQHEVTEFLDGFPDDSGWAALIRVLRRILAGERDPETLLTGLDPIETTIAGRLLDALAGRLRLAPPPAPDPKAADTDDQ